MDGATDVQSGRISAGPKGGDGGWDEPAGSSPDVWPAPGHRAQDAGVLRAAGVPETDPAPASQAGALHRRHRPDPGGRSRAPQEAAPHGQAHLRASQGRVRVRRWIHHGQGLRQRESPSDQGDVRAVVPIRRDTPSATSRRPWWSSAAWSARPTASSSTCPTATAAS